MVRGNGIKVSESFTLEELTRNEDARRLRLYNTPQATEILRLGHMARTVLEPLQRWTGGAVSLVSAYRSGPVNRAAGEGGTADADHQAGAAADIACRSAAEADAWWQWLRGHVDFNELVLHSDGGGSRWWIHVSAYAAGGGLRNSRTAYKVLM